MKMTIGWSDDKRNWLKSREPKVGRVGELPKEKTYFRLADWQLLNNRTVNKTSPSTSLLFAFPLVSQSFQDDMLKE